MLAVTNTKTQSVTIVDYILYVFIYLCWQVTGVSVTVCPGTVQEKWQKLQEKGEICMKVYAVNKVACSVMIIAFAAEKLILEAPLNEDLQTF